MLLNHFVLLLYDLIKCFMSTVFDFIILLYSVTDIRFLIGWSRAEWIDVDSIPSYFLKYSNMECNFHSASFHSAPFNFASFVS